jgi:hypothetical protein
VSNDIHADTARALFKTAEPTTEQRTRARTLNFMRIYGTSYLLPPPQPVAPPPADWLDCPQCKQSCTGKYGTKFGCSRCGWTAGILRRDKVYL